MGGARPDGDPGKRQSMHGEGRRAGGRRRPQGGGPIEGDRAHQPEGDHRHVEQIHRPPSLQRYRLDGRPYQLHLQVGLSNPILFGRKF